MAEPQVCGACMGTGRIWKESKRKTEDCNFCPNSQGWFIPGQKPKKKK